MVDIKILNKIYSNIRQNAVLSIMFTKKFQNNDFEFERDDKKINFDSNKRIYTDNANKCEYFRFYSRECKNNIFIKGKISDFYERKSGTFNGAKFDYVTYRIDGFDFIVLENFLPNENVLDIPNEINGVPVLCVVLSLDIDPTFIKKVIIGTNLIRIENKFEVLKKVDTVIFKDGGSLKENCFLASILIGLYFSNHSIKFKFDDKSNFKIKDKYLLSKDEKELFFIFEKDNFDIPDSVEHIHGTFYFWYSPYELVNVNIKWPKFLKIIDNTFLSKTLLSKIYNKNPLPNSIEVLNCDTIHSFIKGDDLYLSKNIKYIDDDCIEYFNEINNIIIDKNNDYFVYKNKLLLTKDNKRLIVCLDKKNKNVLFIPETILDISPDSLKFCSVKKIALKRNDTNLINQIKNINKLREKKFKIEILETTIVDKVVNKSQIVNMTPEYIIKGNKCYIGNDVSVDILEVGISNFSKSTKKTFVITSECRNIKQLIIPEGVTDIEIDSSCYNDNFHLEILDLPSTCKLPNKLFEELDSINSFMMLIINPTKKLRWLVHKLTYVVACKSNFSMPKGINVYHVEVKSEEDSIVNEITYIKNFNKEKLIITDDAYYYAIGNSKKEIGLLKVKNVSQYSVPEKVDKYKVKKIYDFCYSKYNGSNIDSKK